MKSVIMLVIAVIKKNLKIINTINTMWLFHLEKQKKNSITIIMKLILTNQILIIVLIQVPVGIINQIYLKEIKK